MYYPSVRAETLPPWSGAGHAWRKRLHVLLICALLAGYISTALPPVTMSLPSRSVAENAVAPPAPAPAPAPIASQLPATLVGKSEIMAMRGAHHATYRVDDNQFATLYDAQPMHYQDANGGWQPIDPTFVALADGWVNNTNQLRTQLDNRTSRAVIGTDGLGIRWTPSQLAITAQDGSETLVASPLSTVAAQPGHRSADGRAVRYSESWDQPTIADQWQSDRGQVEYTMRLTALPAHSFWQHPRTGNESLDLHVELQLQPGVTLYIDGQPADFAHTAQVATHNALVFRGATGESMSLQPPVTYEQANPTVAVAGSYLVSATNDPTVVVLRVRTPWSWLAAADRQFPVIIDPLFQMRAETSMATVSYLADTLAPNMVNRETTAGYLGRWNAYAARLLLRFELPIMPQGTTISKALLTLAPNGAVRAVTPVEEASNLATLATQVALYAVNDDSNSQDDDWWDVTRNNIPAGNLTVDLNTPLPPGSQEMSYSDGDKAHFTTWDITSAAQGWLRTEQLGNIGGGVSNGGILIKAANEQCNLVAPGGAATANCGAFTFAHKLDNWSAFEMDFTQSFAKPDNPAVVQGNDTTNAGVRLLVFYSGPALAEGQVREMSTVGGSALPASDNDPYYRADHAYTVPAMPTDRWQAVVVRGRTQPQNVNPPIVRGYANAYKVPVAGALGITMQMNDSQGGAQLNDRVIQSVNPGLGEIGYILFNGRGTPAAATSSPMTARIDSGIGIDDAVRYDVRHIKEAGAMTGVTGQSQSYFLALSSSDPLALYNLTLPAGANSRIDARFTLNAQTDASYLSALGPNLRMQILSSGTQTEMPTSDESAMDFATGEATSGLITPSNGQMALVIANHGPEVVGYEQEPCQGEICGDEPIHAIAISYDITIKITSCAGGEYPTANGGCQKVECPTNAFADANIRDASAGLRLWSQTGWTDANKNALLATSLGGAYAPLLGTTANGGRAHVAALGGQISYNKNTNSFSVTEGTTILLLTCAANNATPSQVFDVYEGDMTGQLGTGLFANLLVPGTPAFNQVLRDPLDPADKADLDTVNYLLYTTTGTFTGATKLTRRIGELGSYSNFKFRISWSFTAGGWPAMTTSAFRDTEFPLHPFAGLNLNFGDSFGLDLSPASGQSGRKIVAVRAKAATISQAPALGGGSEPIQAVLTARGAAIPLTNIYCKDETDVAISCLDLRNVLDDPNATYPNREWEMPDVVTNIDANTVAYSAKGAVTVYSTDHPRAAAGDPLFEKQFSFKAVDAKVVVDIDYCADDVNGDGKVDPAPGAIPTYVVRGKAGIAIPNIGASKVKGEIAASFLLCSKSKEDYTPALRGVFIAFETPAGLPIGTTGVALYGIKGGVNIFPDYTQIKVGVSLGSVGSQALVVGGTILIDTRGLFALQGDGKLLGLVDIKGKLWVAWNPMDVGFEMTISYKEWLKGFMRAHAWEGRGYLGYDWLPDDKALHVTGSIGATLIVKAGQIGKLGPVSIPPANIDIIVALEFGEFCTNESCSTFEWGIKGKVAVLDYEVGAYYGFDSGWDWIWGNDGNHILIDQFGDKPLTPVLAADASSRDAVTVYRAPAAINGTTLITLTVSNSAEQMLLGLGWVAGAPTLSLIDPSGAEINEGNLAAHNAKIEKSPTQVLMSVQTPQAGQWFAKITNLSENKIEGYQFFFVANKGAPGSAGNHGAFTAPTAANEPGNNSYLIQWDAPADTSDQARIALYYTRLDPIQAGDVISGNLQSDVPIVKNLPFKNGSYNWNTSKLLNGAYSIKAVVDDGVNDLPLDQIAEPNDVCTPLVSGLPRARAFATNRFPGTVVFSAAGTLQINDVTAPSAPSNVQVVDVGTGMMAKWTPSPSPDVAHYLVRWGVADAANIVTIEHELLLRENEAYLTPVSDNTKYGVEVIALDVNGNPSPASSVAILHVGQNPTPIPAAPTEFKAMGVGSTNAVLLWTPDAGVAATHYQVTYTKLGAEPATATQQFNQIGGPLNGLTTGAEYAMTVAACNAANYCSGASNLLQVRVTNGVDANNDGMADDWAAANEVTSATADEDSDGLNNADEYSQFSNPHAQDSDGDGLSDAEEANGATNPNDAGNFPAQQSQPRLALAEDNLRFFAVKKSGGEAPAQSVAFQNIGGGTLVLQPASDQAWITAGVNGEQIQISVDSAALAPGFYSGVVKLNAGPGSAPIIGGNQCVRVNTWVVASEESTVNHRVYLPLINR